MVQEDVLLISSRRVLFGIVALHVSELAILLDIVWNSPLKLYDCNRCISLMFFRVSTVLSSFIGASTKSTTQADSQCGILLDMSEPQGRALRRQGEGVLW